MLVNKTEKKQKTMKIPIIISVILSLVIIILILVFTTDTKMLYTVKVRYEFVAIAVMLNIIYWILWGARLKVMSNAIDSKANISLLGSTKIIIANLFLACITPSMAGGEPVRIHLLNKDGMSLGCATAAVLGERLLDAVFILLCAPIAFFIFKDYIGNDLIKVGLWIGIIVFIFGVLLFAYTIKNPEKTKSFLIFINKKLSRFTKKKKNITIINKINTEVDNFHNSMVFFVTKGKKALFKASFLTIIFWLSGFMIPSMLLLGLGLKPFFIESISAQILLLLIIMMPTTPGGSGVTELGVGGLYAVLIGSSLIGVFVLLFRLITYHMNLIAGAFFQYRIFKSVASFSVDTIKKKK